MPAMLPRYHMPLIDTLLLFSLIRATMLMPADDLLLYIWQEGQLLLMPPAQRHHFRLRAVIADISPLTLSAMSF